MLSFFQVRGYRDFAEFRATDLTRLNLIVGGNGAGKTSLLEAIWLCANRGVIASVRDVYATRFFPSVAAATHHPFTRASVLAAIGGRDKIDFEYGNGIGADSVAVSISIGGMFLQGLDESAKLPIKCGDIHYPLAHKRPGVYVPAAGLDADEQGRLWDAVAFTDREDDTNDALRLVMPAIQRAGIIGDHHDPDGRMAVAKLGANGPVPIRALGDGVSRMFGLALALGNSAGGILLVDQIETGLHHAILPDLWRHLLRLARRRDVQVFASTHSEECLAAFVAAAPGDGEASIIRLDQAAAPV